MPDERQTKIDLPALKVALRQRHHLEAFCSKYLEGGAVRGNAFRASSIHGGDGQSLILYLSGNHPGCWRDMADPPPSTDGEDKWSTPLDLVMKVRGCGVIDAARDIVETLGLENDAAIVKPFVPGGAESRPNGTGKASKSLPGALIWPVSEERRGTVGAAVKEWRHFRFGKPDALHIYRDHNGLPIYMVARFEKAPDRPKKQFTPCHFRLIDGRPAVHVGYAPDKPRVIYGADELARKPSAPVLLVEGEKVADAAREIFPDFVAVTTPGGSAAYRKADYSCLSGRLVCGWPDNDPAGRSYIKGALQLALAAGAAEARMVAVPERFGPKWDLADDLPMGADKDALRALMDAADVVDAMAPEASEPAPVSAPEAPQALSAPSVTAAAPADPHAAAWANPDLSPLGTGRTAPPAFPVELLGTREQTLIRAHTAASGAPIEYVAGALFSMIGTLLTGVRSVAVTSNWSESPTLWFCNVGDVGIGKTPALDPFISALQLLEEQLGVNHRTEHLEWTARLARVKAEWSAYGKSFANSDEGGGAPRPSVTVEEVQAEKPVKPQFVVNDATTEALAVLLGGMKRGVLSYNDELVSWHGSFDRYASGGGGADRAAWLKAFEGKKAIINRKSGNVEIPFMACAVLGNIQPDKLPVLLNSPEDGLVARFLYAFPDWQGAKDISTERVDTRTIEALAERCYRLQSPRDPNGVPAPLSVPLSADAFETFNAWQKARKNADVGNTLGLLAGHYSKSLAHVLRLAMTLTYLRWGLDPDASEPGAVPAWAMDTAIALVMDYYRPMAVRTFGQAVIPQEEKNAAIVAKEIRARGMSEFNARELRRAIGGPVREADAMTEACVALQEHGLIRHVGEAPKRGGRTPLDFEVNPAIADMDAVG